MTTGYERGMYNDISRIAEGLALINETLELIRWQLVKDHEQRERHANTNDDAR